jgi:nucleotide-binding universal stress UspA family protein
MKEREMSGPITHPGIIVGVDGSPASNTAVSWAARDARIRNAALTVVHVLPPREAWPRTPRPIDVGPWLEKQGTQVIADAIKIAEESTKQSGRAQINSELFFSATVPTLVNLNRAHARATTRPNNRK